MQITHSYQGIGLEYQKARKGTARFASFMMSYAGFNTDKFKYPLRIVELGIGSGQQTEFVEKELRSRGLTQYTILGFDKSYKYNAENSASYSFTDGTSALRLNPEDVNEPDQLNLLIERINKGELSRRIAPLHYNFDGTPLPVKSKSINLTYMAHVLHHLNNKQQALNEISRITMKNGKLFILGVTIEDLKNHPLDEFFPEKFKYDSMRYPTEKHLKKMFKSAGFTYQEPFHIGKDQVKLIDRDFLASVENTTVDSALSMIRYNDKKTFNRGVTKVRKEVERAEKSGAYRTYFTAIARVFWGIKK